MSDAGDIPDGIMAGLADINAAANQSTLPAIMSREQMADVASDGDGDSASPPDAIY